MTLCLMLLGQKKNNGHDAFYTMLAVMAFMCLQLWERKKQWLCMKRQDFDQISAVSPGCIWLPGAMNATFCCIITYTGPLFHMF